MVFRFLKGFWKKEKEKERKEERDEGEKEYTTEMTVACRVLDDDHHPLLGNGVFAHKNMKSIGLASPAFHLPVLGVLRASDTWGLIQINSKFIWISGLALTMSILLNEGISVLVFFFHWRTIALQYYVSFRHISAWISHRYNPVYPLLNLSHYVKQSNNMQTLLIPKQSFWPLHHSTSYNPDILPA